MSVLSSLFGNSLRLGGMHWDVGAQAGGFFRTMKQVDAEAKRTAGGVSGRFAGMARGLGVAGSAAAAGVAVAGAALLAVGKQAFDASQAWDVGIDNFVKATGKVGPAAEAAGQSILALYGSTAGLESSMGDIGRALGEVDTRLGLSGQALETFTGKALDMTRMAGGDTVANIRNVARVMGDWGVANERGSELLEQLFRASQNFGAGVESLSGNLVRYGAPMRQFGFSLEEAIALMGKWEREGVNLEIVLASLKQAAARFAEENIPLRDGLHSAMAAIRGARTESEALNLAMGMFGARAASDMAAAIREGRFELDEAIESMRTAGMDIEETAQASLTLAERWQVVKQAAAASLAPVGREYIEPIIAKVLELAERAVPRMAQGVGQGFEFVKRAVASARERFAGHVGGMQSAAGSMMAAVTGLFQAGGQALNRLWAQHGEGLLNTLASVGNALGASTQTMLGNMWGIFKAVTSALAGDWGSFGEYLKYIGLYTLQGILSTVQWGLGATAKVFQAVTGFMGRAWQWTWDKLNEITSGRLQAGVDFIKSGFLFIVNTFVQGWDGAVQATSEGLQAVIQSIGRGVAWVANKLADLLEKIPGIGQAAAGGLRSVGQSALDAAASAAAGIGAIFDGLTIEAISGRVTAEIGEFTETIRTEFEDGLEGLDDMVESLIDSLEIDDPPEIDFGEAWAGFAEFAGGLGDLWEEIRAGTGTVSEGMAEAGDALAGFMGEYEDFQEQLLAGGGGAGEGAGRAGASAAQAIEDAFEKLRASLQETLALIDFKLEEGLIGEEEALRARLAAWQRFAEGAFQAGYGEEAAGAAAQVRELTAALAALGEESEEVPDPVAEAQAALERLQASTEAAIEGVRALVLPTAGLGNYQRGLDTLAAIRPQVVALVDWYAGLYDEIEALSPRATVSAEVVGKLTQPLGNLTGGLEALYTAQQGRLGGILAHMRPQLLALTGWYAGLYDEIEVMAPQAQAAAEAAGKLTQPLRNIAEGMEALYGAKQGMLDGFLAHTRPRLAQVFVFFERLYGDIAHTLPEAERSAEAAGRITQPLRHIAEGMEAVYTASKGALDGFWAHTRPRLAQTFIALDRIWGDIERLVPGVEQASEAAGKVLAPVKAIAEGMQALYSAGKGKLDGFWAHTRPRLAQTFTALDRIWGDIADLAADAGATAAGVDRIAGPVMALIEMMGAIYNASKGTLDGFWASTRPQLHATFTALDRIWGDIQDLAPGALQAADATEQIAGGVTALIDMITALEAWEAVPDLQARFEGLRQAWDVILSEMTKVKLFSEDTYARMKQHAEISGDIADGLQSVLELLLGLDKYTSPAAEAISDYIDDYKSIMGDLADWYTDESSTGGAGLANEIVAAAGANAAAVGTGMGDMATALAAIHDYTAIAGETFSAFETDYRRLLGGFASWAAGEGRVLADEVVGEAAANAELVGSGLRAAHEVLADLPGYEAVGAALTLFERDYQTLLGGFASWAGNEGKILADDLVAKVAANAEAIGQGLESMLDVLISLPGFQAVHDEINLFEQNYQHMLSDFGIWALTAGKFLTDEVVGKVATTFQSVGTGLEAVLAVLSALPGFESVHDEINLFEQNYEHLMSDFGIWALTGGKLLTDETVGKVGQVFGTVAGGLEAVLNVLTELPGFQSVHDEINLFEQNYEHLMSSIGIWAATGGKFLADDNIAKVGEVTASLARGIEASFNVLSQLGDYVSPAEQTITDIVDDATLMLTRFAEKVVGELDPAGAAATKAWGESLGASSEGMLSALELLRGITVHVAPTATAVDNFLASVKGIYTSISGYVSANLTAEGMAAVQSFGESLQAVTEGLAGSLSLFNTLANADDATIDFLSGVYTPGETPTSLAAQRLGYLYRAIVNLMTTFKTEVVNKTQSDWLPKAQVVFNALDQVVGVLGDAMGLFSNLKEGGLPSTDEITTFVTRVLQLFGQLATGLTNSSGQIGAAGDDIGDELETINSTTLPPYFQQYYATGTTLGVNILMGMSQGLKNVWGLTTYVYPALSTLGTTILNNQSMTGPLGAALGQGVASSMADAMKAINVPAWFDGALKFTTATSIPQRLWLEYGDDFQTAGLNVGYSFGAGIAGASQYVYNTAYAVGQQAVAGLNAGIDAGSPSKLALQSGSWVGEGLEQGMLEQMGRVEAASRTLGQAAIPDMEGLLGPNMGQMSLSNERHVTFDVYVHGNHMPPAALAEMRDYLIRELEFAR